jgi:hypothetical protein
MYKIRGTTFEDATSKLETMVREARDTNMKVQSILTLSALVSIGLAGATAAHADTTYTSTTTSLDPSPATVVETRSTTLETAPVVIRETQPVYIQPSKEVVIVKKKNHHHLINIGPVKVF